tara:strand:+ start:122 stop:400 length:279 start_codon:yes stop_codon:yes gene_type:complete
LQSQYKYTEVVLQDIETGVVSFVQLRSKGDWKDNLDYPSDREVTKWGYETSDEAMADDMIDTIMESEYEKQKDYLFAMKLVDTIMGNVNGIN